MDGKRVWYSGKDVTVLDVDKKFYGKLPVPANIDEAMDNLMDDYGFTLPLSDVVVSDPYNAFVTNVAAGVVIGDSMINGQSVQAPGFRREVYRLADMDLKRGAGASLQAGHNI